jgi:hypothetical protein
MFVNTECNIGYYSPEGSQECVLCALGRRCDVVGMTETNYYDATYQEGGYVTTLPDAQYTAVCPLGYYCPPGSYGNTDQINTNAIPCPIGTYDKRADLSTTLKALDECIDVNSEDSGDGDGQIGGHYADTPGTTLTMYNEQWCAPGYACPDNTACNSRYCEACPPGQYTIVEGSNTCEPCPDSYYCPGATPYTRT